MSMPAAHVTAQPSGQAIATTGSHRLASRSPPRKKRAHCSSPTATPVARPVTTRAPIPVPAPVSNAPRASPIAKPKAVARIHSGPTLRCPRSANHWAAPITAPARAPPKAPDTAPSTESTSTMAISPPIGKPRKASIHRRKNRPPPALDLPLPATIDPGDRLACRVAPRLSVPYGSGEQEEYAEQGEPDGPQDVPDHHDVRGRFEPGRFEHADEHAGGRRHSEECQPPFEG